MSTLRINNIEAQSVPASPTIDEKVKITNSSGDILVNIDGKTSGITTIGINTTDGNIKFDANSNVLITGILTATTLAGNFTPTTLNVSGGVGVGDSIFHIGDDNTQIRFPTADTIAAETGGTERLRIGSTGLISIGDNTNLDSQLTITQAQGDCIRLRTNTTNNSFKYGIIKQEPYNNNALGLQIIGGKSDSGYSEISIGGGIDGGYAATQIDFYTGSTTTTATGTKRVRIASTGQLLLMSNTGFNPSSSLLSLATDASAAANMLSDSSSIYNHNNPAFVHVQNMNNTGDGQEAGIILHSKSSFGGAWAIYGKRTTSSFKSDLIFRGRSGSSSSAERLRIDSSGRVLIGTTTVGDSTADNLTIADSGTCGITIRSGTSGEGNIFFSDGTSGAATYAGTIQYKHADDALVFHVAVSERLRIKSDGNVIIGSGGSWSYPKALNVQGSSGSILSLYNADTTTYAANTTTAIEFKLLTGNTGNQSGSCEIRAFKENGTNGNNARALSFYTGGNGGSPSEKLRITSDGEVTKPNNPRFQAYMSGTHFQISGGSNNIAYNTEVYDVGSNYNTSNGRFTVPVAGAYYFHHCLQVRAALSGTGVIEAKVWVIPVGGSATERIRDYKHADGTNIAGHAFGVLQLNAGDQVYPAYYSGINPTYVQNNGGNTPLTSFFEGYLVG